MKITQPSANCIQLLEKLEGLKLDAYLDSGGVPTIGIGTIIYPNGQRVKMGDKITADQAHEYCLHDLAGTALAIDALSRDDINQNQFDALCSFVYNVGIGAYRDSTLRKLVNGNPNNAEIRAEFMKWKYVRGLVIPGLITRRTKEADLYFKK